MPQRDERLHARRATSRHPSGGQRDQQQRGRGDRNRHDVARTQTVEKRSDERTGEEREREKVGSLLGMLGRLRERLSV